MFIFFGVVPASKARRESFRKDSGQAGMTVRWIHNENKENAIKKEFGKV